MIIRPLKKSDDKQMLVLMDEFWNDYWRGEVLSENLKRLEKLKDVAKTMQDELAKYHKWITFIAEQDNELIGFIVGDIDPKAHKVLDNQGYIEEFFVTEKYRHQGVGKELFDKLIDEFKVRGCKTLCTDTYVTNVKTIEYYKKLGFKERNIVFVRDI